MKVDLDQGVMEFTPQAGKPVSAGALKQAIEGAGYGTGKVTIRAAGELTTDSGAPALKIPESGQIFLLEGRARFAAGNQASVSGVVKSRRAGLEVIEVTEGSHQLPHRNGL